MSQEMSQVMSSDCPPKKERREEKFKPVPIVPYK